MHEQVRAWIVDVLTSRPSLLAIAFRQRAKFEGWLKFELAARAEQGGASDVCVEASSDNPSPTTPCRSDVTFSFEEIRYDVELKTPNSSWRLPGVLNRTRPITKNIAEIIADALKLARSSTHGIVAFVLFPIPPGNALWVEYLDRIAKSLALPLDPKEHTMVIEVPLSGTAVAHAVVCCFEVPPALGGPAPNKAMNAPNSR